MHTQQSAGLLPAIARLKAAADANIAVRDGSARSPLDREIEWSTCASGRVTKARLRRVSTRHIIREMLHRPATAHAKPDLPLIYPGTWLGDSRERGSRPLLVSAIMVEHDAGKLTMDWAARRLRDANISAIFYETPSANDGERWRCVCPLSLPIPVTDRRRSVQMLNAMFGGEVAAESGDDTRWWFIGSLVGTRPRRMIEVE